MIPYYMELVRIIREKPSYYSTPEYKAWRKERRDSAEAAGLCRQCWKLPVVEGLKACEPCRAKGEYRRNLPGYKDREHKRALNRKRECERAGICNICYKLPVIPRLKRCAECRETLRQQKAITTPIYNAQIKQIVMNHYGDGTCACCHESNITFLNIDHVFDNGAEERARIGRFGGCSFYRWLKNNNFPPGYRVLCFNCNHGRYINGGICPHEEQVRNFIGGIAA